ncbi:MAG: hypothetical protein UV07_C0031G0003 [Candidatus Azambacteria bacterium GW2011_GWB1_42_17]|uniref:Uncharacterized protein n=1 Tax=Candidatus Azambacteria bacterium GW2011_GWB1_42_17 TaxID=1618615 RepID=A0A0G0Z4E7_9BACT|nr:MAG: hypothetical protein UV07_C0031G0003 [Candidatus Azambacteria bacterium GW2011_GWB1_42_17]OGZ98681.1 MAG: hypothetical protein A3D57_02940 [Candidatus Sungbacteria bacterium RIFCSPHIGHO2_02_FULL_46_12]
MKTANTLSHEKKNNKMNQQTKRGFTLVELIVSMALFIIVVFITTSAFLSVVNLNKKARATRTAIDSLSIAMERMTRMIRTGTDYYCTNDETGFYNTSYVLSDLKTSIVSSSDAGDCTGEDFLLFESSEGGIAGYTLRRQSYGYTGPTPSEYNPNDCGIQKKYGTSMDSKDCRIQTRRASLGYITDADIEIEKLSFYVAGTQSSVFAQPRVNIVLQGVVGTDPKIQTKFSIYTSVTQRAPK